MAVFVCGRYKTYSPTAAATTPFISLSHGPIPSLPCAAGSLPGRWCPCLAGFSPFVSTTGALTKWYASSWSAPSCVLLQSSSLQLFEEDRDTLEPIFNDMLPLLSSFVPNSLKSVVGDLSAVSTPESLSGALGPSEEFRVPIAEPLLAMLTKEAQEAWRSAHGGVVEPYIPRRLADRWAYAYSELLPPASPVRAAWIATGKSSCPRIMPEILLVSLLQAYLSLGPLDRYG